MIVTIFFVYNDIAWGLSPAITSGIDGGVSRAKTRHSVMSKLMEEFVAKNGPSSISFGPSFIGEEPVVEGLNITHIRHSYSASNLADALKTLLPLYQFEVEDYSPVAETGELSLFKMKTGEDEYAVKLNKQVVEYWSHIRQNDICYEEEETLEEGVSRWQAVSLADRLLNHIRDRIIGRSSEKDDAEWLWFIASYSSHEVFHHDNDALLKWLSVLFANTEAQEKLLKP